MTYKSLNIFFLLIASLSSVNCYSQCEEEDFLDECSESLKGYRFLMAHKVYADDLNSGGANSGNSKAIIMSKGISYIITACTGNESSGKLLINLFDPNHKPIASNKDPQTMKIYSAIAFNCESSGLYYLRFKFEERTGHGCGVSVIGLKTERRKPEPTSNN